MRTFKFGPAQADERFVNDSADPASPRVAHDLVNDSGDAPAAPNGAAPLEGVAGRRISDPAGFRFNLDDALARLSEPHQPIPRFNWSSVTPSPTDLATTDLATTDLLHCPGDDEPGVAPGTDAHGRHGADGRRSASCRAEPDVDALDVPRSGLASPPAHPTDPRSAARDPRGDPGRPRRHITLVVRPRACPAAGRRARVGGSSGARARRRSDDRDGQRRLRGRRERIQP